MVSVTVGLAALLLLSLVGCASSDRSGAGKAGKSVTDAPSAQSKASFNPIRASFPRSGGKVALEYGNDGRWVSIASIATAPVGWAGQASVDQAVSVATLKARRNLAEFMGGELQTSRSLRVISRGVQRSVSGASSRQTSEVSSDEEIDDRAEATLDSSHEKVAQTVRETISQRSAAILKGVMTTREDHDREAGTVTVEITASQRSIDAARSIRQEMER